VNSSSKSSDHVSKIIHAAAQLFARQGYHGTSTREIARIAEVSENTLFRQFEHKEEIFWAALRSQLSGLRLRRDLIDSIAQSAEPEVVLPQLLTQLVDIAFLKPDLLRLVAVGLIELNWKTKAVCYEYLSPIFSTVYRYLATNIEIGRLRKLNPSMLTAALTTVVMVHSEFSKFIAGAAPPYTDSREAIQAYTKFWLDILMPHQYSEPGFTTGIPESLPD